MSSGEADRRLSDADQTASAADQTSADRDQRASDRDQKTADRAHAEGVGLTSADERAYDEARDERATASVERLGNQLDRASTARDRDLTARLRAALEAGPNAVVAVDGDGRIVYANLHVEQIFGYEPDQLVGRPLEILLPERVAAIHVAHRRGFAAHPTARQMGSGLEVSGRRKDGSEFPIEVSLSPVETPDGPQVFATVVDVTARRAMEGERLHAEKLKSIGRMVAGITHDFNNMLFAIHGHAELLAEDLAHGRGGRLDAAGALESVASISVAAERAAALTAQLLAFSRHQVLVPKVVDLNHALSTIEPLLRQLIGEDMELRLDLDETAGHLRLDPGQIDQIVVNLVVNARDAMPGGGVIFVETGRATFGAEEAVGDIVVPPGTWAFLAVRDSGIGMDRATREQIYEPFFTTKEVGHGTGLGLSTTHGIVGQGGGHIALISEPGLGASFTLYFPRVEATIDAPVPAMEPSAVGTGRVLVVEDDDAVRLVTARLLERSGYDVFAVPGGAEALAVARTGRPIDILVTDVVMPQMSGVALAESMMDAYPRLAVVLLSGYVEETAGVEPLMSRGATFVAKPVTWQRLSQAVVEAAAASRSISAH